MATMLALVTKTIRLSPRGVLGTQTLIFYISLYTCFLLAMSVAIVLGRVELQEGEWVPRSMRNKFNSNLVPLVAQ